MNVALEIQRCIRRVSRHQDGRGPWQAQRSLDAALQRAGTDPAIARMCADAARRLGEFLRSAA